MKTLNTKVLEYLRDPLWQFLGIIAALIFFLISTLITYDLFYRSRLDANIAVIYDGPYLIVWEDPTFDDDIEIQFRGEDATNVSSIYFKLQNTGNTPIRPEDYASPIKIELSVPAELAGVEITQKIPASIDLEISEIFTNSLLLSEALLNPSDIVEFRAILVNNSSLSSRPPISVSARIAGVHDIQVVSRNDNINGSVFVAGGFSFNSLDLMQLALLTSLVLFLTVQLLIRRRPDYLSDKFIGLKITLLSLMSGILCFWATHSIPVLLDGRDDEWWAFWFPGVMFGAFVILVYVLYVLFVIGILKIPKLVQKTTD